MSTTTPDHPADSRLPPLVRQALLLAEQQQFGHSARPEVGRLLHVLTSQILHGRVGEIGSGCGYGAAWIVSALRPGVAFFTIELEPTRAAAVQRLLANCPAAHALHDDWHALLSHGPFDLLFADGGHAKQDEPDALIAVLRPGGLLLLDDLTPEERWPPEWRGRPDPLRAFWLHDPRLSAIELRVSADHAVILASRLG